MTITVKCNRRLLDEDTIDLIMRGVVDIQDNSGNWDWCSQKCTFRSEDIFMIEGFEKGKCIIHFHDNSIILALEDELKVRKKFMEAVEDEDRDEDIPEELLSET